MLSVEVNTMRMLKVDDETYSKVCELAGESHTSRANFIHDAVEAREDYLEWKAGKVNAGLAAVESGDFVTSKEMEIFVDELKERLKAKYK